MPGEIKTSKHDLGSNVVKITLDFKVFVTDLVVINTRSSLKPYSVTTLRV